jgi:hypothetical protein
MASKNGEHMDAWVRGYEDQAAWLRGKSRAEAQQALEAREATLSADPYNDGGTQATRNYIDHIALG